MPISLSNNSTLLRSRCKLAIKTAVDIEADRQMMTASAYIRRAVVRSLEADGAIDAPAPRRKVAEATTARVGQEAC